VAPLSVVDYQWPLSSFESEEYHLRVYSSNGFYREYRGDEDSFLEVQSSYSISADPKDVFLEITVKNTHPQQSKDFVVENIVYDSQVKKLNIKPMQEKKFKIALRKSFNWYDISIKETSNNQFLRKWAGRVENGLPSKTDPVMGGMKGSV
jgi:phospholipase C